MATIEIDGAALGKAGAELRSSRLSDWLAQATRMTAIETAMYLRDKMAIFWTFVYPIVLLVLLMAAFGGDSGRFQARVDVEGKGALADRYVTLLQSRFAAIDGSSFKFRRVAAATPTPADRVRVIVPALAGTSEAPGAPIVVRLRGTPDAESGSMLSIVAETATQLNANLAGTPQIVPVQYNIVAPDSAAARRSADASATYYVIGIGVLTMISIALFGFSGPLIELRARGGLKRFQFMPVYRTAFLAGFALCRVLILFLFVLVFLFLGLTLYAGLGDALAIDWGVIALLVAAGTIAFLAAGLALAGVVTSNTLASAVINFVNLPIMFLSDLFIPIKVMPQIVQSMAQYSPVYLLVNAMRRTSTGTFDLADCVPAFTALGIMLLLSFAVILMTFRWRLAR